MEKQAPGPAPAPADPTFRAAVAAHQDGRMAEAADLYRRVLAADGSHALANHNLGVIAVQTGEPAAGLPHFIAALEADPAQGQYWVSYIDALIQAGLADDARQVLDLARGQGLEGPEVAALSVRLAGAGTAPAAPPPPSPRPVRSRGKAPSPQEAEALVALFAAGRLDDAAAAARALTGRFPAHWLGWKMLGVVLQRQGRNAEALAPMQTAAKLAPEDAEAHNNLGILYRHLGRVEESASSHRRALRIDPDYARAHGNLGVALMHLARPADAEASFRHALRLNPGDAEAWRNLSIVLRELGRGAEAEAAVRRALELAPHDLEALGHLGAVLLDLGRAGEAEAAYRRALALAPDNHRAHNNLGAVLLDLGRNAEAEASLRRAIDLRPDFVEALSNLGVCLREQGRLDDAEASYRQALAIDPACADALGNLGGVLHDLGRIGESVDSFRRSLELDPGCARTHSNLLFGLSQLGEVGPRELFAEHLRFGERFEAPLRAGWPQPANSREPDRRLRVGFISGDFRTHAIAFYVEPVIAALAGRPGLELHAYSSHVIEDAVTDRLRGHFARWTPVAGLGDAAVAARIRDHGIDILIDLSGHTAKNRLTVLARKPAPLQASWMGYPGTTGLTAVDYYLADRLYLPAGRFDDQFTEKIVRLPASAPFLPSPEAPPVGRLPALDAGHLTFGSFNRLGKLSRAAIALWSRLLRALPSARMRLGAMRPGERYDALLTWFADEGIAPERLDFVPRSDMRTYLAQHQAVDLCLDSVPYNGGTTTLHALWMGVPTLTLAGATAAARSGSSILGHVGLEDFVARDADDFVRIGMRWAGQPAALAGLRAGLRERIAGSPISRPPLIAAGIDCALRAMWRRWCAGQPAESFEVTDAQAAVAEAEPSP